MATFGSLWVGGPLKKLQETCLASFVYYGHDITLWVYDLDMQVPNGVKKRDARELVPESNIFLVKNTYAAFSDIFRYKMVDALDMIWVDADTLCCSEDWDFFDDDLLFSKEYGGAENYFVGGVMKLPDNSLISKYIVKKSQNFHSGNVKWAEVGPLLLSSVVQKFGYESYAQDPKVLCMITTQEAPKFWNERYKNEIIKRTRNKETRSASLYNGMLTIFGNGRIDTNILPRNSAMEYFYNEYVVGGNK